MDGFGLSVALLLTILALTDAFSQYQEAIPNGDLVPHPCKPNYLWKGVGHLNVLGGGARNPFGQDFAQFGRTWTKALCEKDSDGDGRTNGQELGDPDCKWTPKTVPSAKASGHPGVCEPVESDLCKAKNGAVQNNWDFCAQGEFKCDPIKEPGIKNFKIAIDAGTPVPATETNYMCQMMKLPDDKQYHIIGVEAAIDNLHVAHHIIIYGCEDAVAPKLSKYSSPQPCEAMLISNACPHRIRGWTVGENGYCEKEDVGTRFGKNVFNYAVIEIHWNNPTGVSTYTDGSGVTVFYTEQLRKYDRGRLALGQQSLAIPPNVDAHYESSVCTSDCTGILDQPINIYSVLFHMHYLGRAGRAEHWRNGTLLRILADSSDYSYDSPTEYPVEPPAILQPGDELKMFCKFKSTSTNKITYWGEGTSDEMCFAFLAYYPSSKLRFCPTFGPLDVCDPGKDMSESNDFRKKFGCEDPQSVLTRVYMTAAKICGSNTNPVCTPECKKYLKQVFEEEACMKDGLRFVYEFQINRLSQPGGDKLISMLRVCDKELITVNSELQYYEKDRIRNTWRTGNTDGKDQPSAGTGNAQIIASGFATILITAIGVSNFAITSYIL